jgi:hypothetical protein
VATPGDNAPLWPAGGHGASAPLRNDPLDGLPASEHPLLSMLLQAVPIAPPFIPVAPFERGILAERLWHESVGPDKLGFSAKTALTPVNRHAVRGAPRQRISHMFCFLGRPIAEVDRDNASIRGMAQSLWWAFHFALGDYLAASQETIRKDIATEYFGKPLYELLSFLLPCRNIWVLETNFDSSARLLLKYTAKIVDGKMSIQPSGLADRPLDPMPYSERRTGRRMHKLGQSGVECEFFLVNRLSELARQSRGTNFGLASLGLSDSAGYVALAFRSPDIEVSVLTDARNSEAVARMDAQRVLQLLKIASSGLMERLELIRQTEIIRTDIRHQIVQAHDKSEVWLRDLQKTWVELESKPAQRDHKVTEDLATLADQMSHERARIATIGASAFTALGTRKKSRSSRGENFSVVDATSDPARNIDLIAMVDGLIAPLQRDMALSLRFDHAEAAIWIKTHVAALQACVSEILNNATKYAAPGTPIVINAAAHRDHALLRVENAGPRLTKREQELVKRFGFRGAAAIQSGRSGSGGGLSLVNDTLRELGFTFSYEHAPSADEGVNHNAAARHIVSITVPQRWFGTATSSD